MLTLASDFGSPYPAAMRGVILAVEPAARLVDVAHDLPRGDVRQSAFWLAQVLPWFPPAVHCAVVDPGVGTDRDVLVARVGEHVIVGPDNGLCLPPARAIARRQLAAEIPGAGSGAQTAWTGDGGELSIAAGADPAADVELFAAEPADVVAGGTPASATFHGRDVFAPLAARVHAAGAAAVADLEGLAAATDHVDCVLPVADRTSDGARGDVLAVDGFGNVVTNVPGSWLRDHAAAAGTATLRGHVRVDGDRVPVGHSYAHVERGARLVTVGSHGNVELAVNDGRGSEAFGLGVGDAVSLGWD